MFLTNWNLIFILVNFFHFLPISWATWFCNVWLLTSHWEKNKSIYAVSLNQAKHCRKHQKSWGQPKSWEVVLPNQLSRIHNHRTYKITIYFYWKSQNISQKELDQSIAQIQVMMDLRNRSVEFTTDESSGARVVKVVDSNSGDVIRQMPAEELLSFMRNLTRMLGTFIDKST